MKISQTVLCASLVATLTLVGCGGTGADDPLTGTWSNTTCYALETMPPDIASCSVTLTFTVGLDIDLEASWVSMPAAATQPRCTTTRSVTGQHWSTASGVVTITGRGESSIVRTGCVNAADDMVSTPTSDISIASGEMAYSITGNQLTIASGKLAGTYSL